MLDLITIPVGEYQTNCYLLVDRVMNQAMIIDPGAQPDRIMKLASAFSVKNILITHGHMDHVGALEDVRDRLRVPVYAHLADVFEFHLDVDHVFRRGEILALGGSEIRFEHVPGHTPGSIALQIFDHGNFKRALVGDAIFPGGPGKTESNAKLRIAIRSLEKTVFTWDDDVQLYPGHGPGTTVGDERAAFLDFLHRGIPEHLFGDVSWA